MVEEKDQYALPKWNYAMTAPPMSQETRRITANSGRARQHHALIQIMEGLWILRALLQACITDLIKPVLLLTLA
ncbi:hypothetical protein HYU10_04385 [Candidatus Woesearchaeota archaeon]|nr:hypothetical protein [Candidatus Woesearchaeota archaeon]